MNRREVVVSLNQATWKAVNFESDFNLVEIVVSPNLCRGTALDLEKIQVQMGDGGTKATPRTPATPDTKPLAPWPTGAPYPVERQISVRFPTVITPSEVAGDYRGDTDPKMAADQYIGSIPAACQAQPPAYFSCFCPPARTHL